MSYINGSELANKRFIQLENGDLREVQGKFIPEIGEYYYLNILGDVRKLYNHGASLDKWVIGHSLVFATEKDCEDYKHFLEMLDEYTFEPNWDDPKQERWTMRFDHVEHRIEWLRLYAVQYHGFCFNSKKRGEAFVEKVGEKAVKRYMFDYWR